MGNFMYGIALFLAQTIIHYYVIVDYCVILTMLIITFFQLIITVKGGWRAASHDRRSSFHAGALLQLSLLHSLYPFFFDTGSYCPAIIQESVNSVSVQTRKCNFSFRLGRTC